MLVAEFPAEERGDEIADQDGKAPEDDIEEHFIEVVFRAGFQ